MGFMAGFGKAFAASFENQNQRIHEAQRDAFRVAYEDYARKQAQYQEDERAWKKAVEAGKLMAERLGAPPEAGLKAAEWINAGYSLDDVEKMMATTKFIVEPEITFDYQTPNPQSMDVENIQMASSGLTEPVAPTPEPTATGPEGNNEGLLNNMFGDLFNNVGMSTPERAQTRLVSEVGQEQFDKVSAGFQPPAAPSNLRMETSAAVDPLEEFGLSEGVTDAKLIAAKAKVAQWARSGDPVLEAKAERFNAILPDIEAAALQESNPEEAARIAEALRPTQTLRWELGQQRSLAYTVASQGKELVDMVEKTDGMVLTTTAQAVSIFEAVKTEGNAFIAIVDNILGQNQDPTEEQMMAAVDNFVNEQLNTGKITEDIAQAYKEFHAAAIRYVYNVGRSLGQQGNGFSNKDFQFIYSSIITAPNKDAFIANLKRYAKSRFDEVQTTQDQLLRMSDIRVNMSDPKIAPYLKHELTPMQEQYPELYGWMNTATTATTPNPSTTTKPLPKVGTIRVDEQTGIQWRFVGPNWDNWEQISANPQR
jgi:hypothetical protein